MLTDEGVASILNYIDSPTQDKLKYRPNKTYFVLVVNLETYYIVDIFGSGLTVKLFADDVKMYAIISDVNDSVLLQEGLDALYAWSDLWQLPLSLQKCPILHLGRNNTIHN